MNINFKLYPITLSTGRHFKPVQSLLIELLPYLLIRLQYAHNVVRGSEGDGCLGLQLSRWISHVTLNHNEIASCSRAVDR